jgi:hypothetical protein
MVKYMVKKRCFHLAFRCLYKIIKSGWNLLIKMLHIISWQNRSKNLPEVSFKIYKIEFFQTHLTLVLMGQFWRLRRRLEHFASPLMLSTFEQYSIINKNSELTKSWGCVGAANVKSISHKKICKAHPSMQNSVHFVSAEGKVEARWIFNKGHPSNAKRHENGSSLRDVSVIFASSWPTKRMWMCAHLKYHEWRKYSTVKLVLFMVLRQTRRIRARKTTD